MAAKPLPPLPASFLAEKARQSTQLQASLEHTPQNAWEQLSLVKTQLKELQASIRVLEAFLVSEDLGKK